MVLSIRVDFKLDCNDNYASDIQPECNARMHFHYWLVINTESKCWLCVFGRDVAKEEYYNNDHLLVYD